MGYAMVSHSQSFGEVH